MEKNREFGELELAILQIFNATERLTVKNVLESLEKGDKYTTIMTVMNRMVEKKFLLREKVGLRYEYWINQKDKITKPKFLDKLKAKIFGGKSAIMVSYLLESSDDISVSELDEMEILIKKLKKSRKKS